MYSLGSITWDYAGLYDAAAPEESSLVGSMGVASSVFRGEMYAPNLVLFQLWERNKYIDAHEKVDELYRAHLSQTNASEAKHLATEEYIQEVHARQIEKDSDISSREDINQAVRHILHRGARWSSLVAAVGSAEVLLMDDRLYIGVVKAIGDIIKDGTDEEFDKLKTDLLNVEGRVRDTCLALSGVTEMLFELSESPKDSITRRNLTRAITGRFDNLFGQPGPDMRRDPDKKVAICSDYLLRSVVDIFGFSIRFPEARGQLSDADRSSLSLREQWERLMGLSHQDTDIHDSMEVEEPEGLSDSGPTPPGTYAGLSPSNDFLYDQLE